MNTVLTHEEPVLRAQFAHDVELEHELRRRLHEALDEAQQTRVRVLVQHQVEPVQLLLMLLVAPTLAAEDQRVDVPACEKVKMTFFNSSKSH